MADKTINAFEEENVTLAKTPWPLKLLGILCLVAGVALVTNTGIVSYDIADALLGGELASYSIITRIAVALFGALALAIVVLLVFLGIRLLRNNRRKARLIAEILIALTIAALMCLVMLFGMKGYLIVPGILLLAEIALLSYIDPTLAEERELQRKLRKMETRTEVEEGTLGLDSTGKGYIRLDFFNIFWIFVVCCVLGIVVEVAYHMIVVEPGVYQNRTGLLWGQFSPIYGFGAVLMTIALNRFHDRSLIMIFLVSAVIGGAFEFFVSWFMEVAFGVTAWDYTGTFMSIGGRTNFMFMCMWGTLGVVWIRFCLPRMLKIVNMIPWKWRYSITTIAAAFMICNGVMTLVALDCWAERLAGVEPDNAITRYCANHYDDEWMEHRFQSMTINPEETARV
ncbi:MAG: putative ABC transporter permease [Eggerthellaceae bacterium]|nr:putative ABC transporter permease [Eggerthellaceae bacterium]